METTKGVLQGYIILGLYRDNGKRKWRLLFGGEDFRDLPTPRSIEATTCARENLAHWWLVGISNSSATTAATGATTTRRTDNQ